MATTGIAVVALIILHLVPGHADDFQLRVSVALEDGIATFNPKLLSNVKHRSNASAWSGFSIDVLKGAIDVANANQQVGTNYLRGSTSEIWWAIACALR
jgi:hypothetical protein